MLLDISAIVAAVVTSVPLAIATVLGVYEVIARAYPTIKDITIVGNTIKFLGVISDLLNKKK